MPILLLLLWSLLTVGCLEHNYHLTVLPTGEVDVDLEIRGDRMDLEDGRELLPDSLAWGLTRLLEEDDRETTHIITGSASIINFADLDSLFDWRQTPEDSVFLRRKWTLTKRKEIFGQRYDMEIQFFSRRFDELNGDIWDFVPTECHILDDPDVSDKLGAEAQEALETKFTLGLLQWNKNRYECRLGQVWRSYRERLTTGTIDTSSEIFSIARAGWVDDVRLYLNQLDIPDPNYVNLDWWEELRPVFLGRLVDITGPSSVDLLSRIADAVEREYQISKDTQDDVYKIRAKFPGISFKSNGKKRDDDQIEWEIKGKELMNCDQMLKASSFEPSWFRIVLMAFLIILGLRVLRKFVFYPKK
ncbi:MAG: hypothetical protein V2A61_02860 [Calditrichota bacterium]